jgi:TolA-binding protein
MRAMIILGMLAALAVPALVQPAEAQARLPRRSPSERQVDDINRSVQQREQQRSLQQQNQIDRNQVRESIDRQRMFTSPPVISPRIGHCPAGSIGC